MDKSTYKPEFLYLSNASHKKIYEQYLLNPNSEVYDTINLQLKELIKHKNPAQSFSEKQLSDLVQTHIGLTPIEFYGVWVYYPWSKNLIHLLDETEFAEVRTARNKYKITAEEQQTLGSKIICIIGLSVGQSVALTLAMERSFGELRMADFDTLDLGNLNRLRAGVHQIGSSKTVICAREISELDPFLKVTLFNEGILESNIDDFLTKGGNAHLLIEECDSFEIKIRARFKAKQYKIPVIMETSDRGMLDIERFDMEPDRPIFHGLIGDIALSDVKAATPDKIMNYLLAIVGAETLSDRMKQSMPELKKSITGWPQLASAVVMGGGVAAHISRKILLDQSTVSGRFYIDLDEIIR